MKVSWMDYRLRPDGNGVDVVIRGVRWWHPSWWSFALPALWSAVNEPVLVKLYWVPILAFRSGYRLRRR